MQSRPLVLTVVQGNPPSASGEQETAFLRIKPATKTIYLGQILPVQIQCYCRNNVDHIYPPQLSSDNYIIGEIQGAKQQATSAQVGNTLFNHFTFSTTATAVKAGTYPLGPATWNMMVYDGRQRNFFGMLEGRQHSFTSDTPAITVVPVPTAGAPASFNGAVGEYSISQYEAGPTSVAVGDPITLKIRIAGRGSFDTVTLPTNIDAAWREFKTYPPTSKAEAGSKNFEQIITPQNAEVKEIPAFAFSYFDPDRRTFVTLTHPAIPLTVQATAAVPQPTVVSAGGAPAENQDQAEDIVHIKPMMGKVDPIAPPLIEQPKFLVLQAVAPAIWICALARRRFKERLANNPRLRRQRRVAVVMREGLAQLPRLADRQRRRKILLDSPAAVAGTVGRTAGFAGPRDHRSSGR